MLQLPGEIAGSIYSKTSVVPHELRYVSKETLEALRYQTHLKGRINLKSLFVKTKDNRIVLFHHNLKSLLGVVVVNNIEELQYVPMIIKKLNSITIEYNGYIEDTFSFIQSFVKTKCEYMKVYVLSNYTSIQFTIERRNELIVADITYVVESYNISNYMDGVNSVLINNINSSDKIGNLIIRNNIRMLHLDTFPEENFHPIILFVNTLYITSKFHYNDFEHNNAVFPNITKIEFDDILISGEVNIF